MRHLWAHWGVKYLRMSTAILMAVAVPLIRTPSADAAGAASSTTHSCQVYPPYVLDNSNTIPECADNEWPITVGGDGSAYLWAGEAVPFSSDIVTDKFGVAAGNACLSAHQEALVQLAALPGCRILYPAFYVAIAQNLLVGAPNCVSDIYCVVQFFACCGPPETHES